MKLSNDPLLRHYALDRARKELQEELAQDNRSMCGLYDLVEGNDGEIYRAPVGMFTEPQVLMHSPLPARYWSLPRIQRRGGRPG